MVDPRKYAEKAIRKQEMPKALLSAYLNSGMASRVDGVFKRTEELFRENADVPKAVMMHYEQILPCIAFYEDLLKLTGNREEALAFYDAHVLDEIRKSGETIQKVMKIPGLYKIMPGLFRAAVKKMFGEAAGFQMKELGIKDAFAIDMTACPYVKTCIRYGHPEIAHYFCDSDDITYGHMHPCLVWERTKTIGRGDEICDFRLYRREGSK